MEEDLIVNEIKINPSAWIIISAVCRYAEKNFVSGH